MRLWSLSLVAFSLLADTNASAVKRRNGKSGGYGAESYDFVSPWYSMSLPTGTEYIHRSSLGEVLLDWHWHLVLALGSKTTVLL